MIGVAALIAACAIIAISGWRKSGKRKAEIGVKEPCLGRGFFVVGWRHGLLEFALHRFLAVDGV
jgi:hypothetical protein